MSKAVATLHARSEGPIRWIVIDNQSRLNAFTRDMWAAVPDLVQAADRDPDARVIIFTGAGERSFSAGADISEFAGNRTGDASRAYDEINDAAYQAILAANKPTIAMVRGYCFGGACELAVCCDLRVAADDAVFSVPSAKLSLGYNPRWIKPMLSVMSPAKAKEMLFTGRRYGAAEALQMGLVGQVVPAAEHLAATLQLAGEIAANAPLSIHAAKAAVDEMVRNPESADMARLEALASACFDSEDYKEGQRAFLEKRKPLFHGR